MLLLLLLWARASFAIRITGAGGGENALNSPQPFRYEINLFSRSGPAWDLFVQALGAVQSRDQSDPMSYFQIAGIHGWPRIPWDGVEGSGPMPGYCTHSSTTFTTWHRPYLALYEQAIWQAAQTIARSYPDESRPRYQSAALTLRVPYWDTTANPFLPVVITVPFLDIETPNGQQTVSNPLFNYTFKSDAAGNGFPSDQLLANWPWTVRWWNGNSSDQSAATAAIQSNAANLLATVYRIFTTVSDFAAFSTTAAFSNGTSNSAINIENVHNYIHNSVGGNGHMLDPGFAAFDPVFWLHHANVDRQFAMWQALYTDSYISSAVTQYGTYYELPGSLQTGSSVLAPFHSTDDGTSMWTSDGVRSTATFQYSYPELPYWRMNASALADNVRSEVNRLYNPAAPAQRRRTIPRMTTRAPSLAQAFSHVTFEDAKSLGVNNAERQWFAKLQMQKYASETGFTIFAFMGEPILDANQWSWAPNLIGTHGQFIAVNVSCLFPGGAPSGTIHGEMSLTHTLVAGVDRGLIANLEPETVVPLLQKGLHWRAKASDGSEFNITELKGLAISVGSRRLTPSRTIDQFPVYGDIEWHSDVTQNTPGGVKQWYRLAR